MIKNVKIYLIVLAIAIVLLLTTLYQIKLKVGSSVLLATIIISTTLLTYLVSIFIHKQKKFDEMMAFKLIIPIIAILFIIAMPIFRSHDEDAHWYRIYDISQGNLLTSTEYGILFQEGATNYPAGKFPKAVFTLVNRTYSGAKAEELFQIKIDEEEKIFIEMPTTAVYSPTQYLPQAIGVTIARIFTDRPIIMAYCARAMNIIVSFTALYFAIKFMPFGKKILLVIMSIPIALEGFSSLSPDGMTISFSFLFIAYLLHLAFEKKEEKITWQQTLFVTTLGVLLALCKIVYLPLVGLIFLLPRTKFNSRKSQIIHAIIMMAVAVIANLTWLSISTGYLAEYKEGRPVEQLGTLLQNPINYLEMLVYSIDLNGTKYFLSMLGGEIGLNEFVILNTIVPFAFCIMCLMATFSTRENRPKFSLYQVTIMALIVFAIVGLIFTSLYLQWTEAENESIMGVQGRYFLPVLPLALLLLSCFKVKIEYSETTITKWLAMGILLLQICIIPMVFCIRKLVLYN